MKNVNHLLLISLLSILFSSNTNAQAYDLSQYKARWERRPAMFILPDLSYFGTHSNLFPSNRNVGFGLDWTWQESRNTDIRMETLVVELDNRFNWARSQFSDFQHNLNSQIGIQYERFNYYRPDRFWGFNLTAGSSLSNNKIQNEPSNVFFNVGLNPGIFFGRGRIEFAEDVLLAHWMLEDLQTTQTITTYTGEQQEALARRITSIIGNRTFDFRRRRIYELQQLHELFQEEGIAADDEFMLFAVLNDNWAFANRASLPHGKRHRFGLNFGSDFRYQKTSFDADFFQLSVSPYWEYQRSRILPSQHGVTMRLGANAFYQQPLDDQSMFFPNTGATLYGVDLNAGYDVIWLPNSRTRLSFVNNFTTRVQEEQSDFFATRQDLLLIFNTNLDLNYFINYNWTLNLRFGSFIQGSFDENRVSVSPVFIQLSSQYFIF